MFPSLHAILILGTLVVPLTVVAVNHTWHPHPLQQVLGFVVAVLALGIVCMLLLMPGVPIAEWLFPLIGIVLAGLFAKNQRLAQGLCWGLLIASVGLCANALALRVSGYTSAPPSLYASLDRMHLEYLGKELRQKYPLDQVLAPGLVKEMLPQLGKVDWDRKTLRPLWHTSLTRLYEVVTTPGVVWYPGGPVSLGSENLQWKPKSSPDAAGSLPSNALSHS